MDEGRRRHYGTFYGLDEPSAEDLPVVVIYGNCQAEALRVALTSGSAADVTGIRIPPAHELVADDVPHLERTLARADVLVTQPIRDGFRGLPLGDNEIRQWLRPDTQVVRVPVVFYRGLYPFQVVVHDEGVVDPPLVPYQDLRFVAEAAGMPVPRLSADPICRVVRDSLAELRRREEEQDLLVVSDAVHDSGADAMHTVNHPGNPVLLALATRLRERLGLPAVSLNPGRTLLSSVITPLAAEVVDALGLDAEPRSGWVVDGASVDDEEVRETHLRWLADHPAAVEATLRRHGDDLRQFTGAA